MDLTTHPAKNLKRHKNNEVSSPHLIETKFEPKLSFFKWLIFFQQFTLHLEQTVFRVSNSAKHTFVLCERSLLELYDNFTCYTHKIYVGKIYKVKISHNSASVCNFKFTGWVKTQYLQHRNKIYCIVKTKFKITLN